MGGHSAWRKRVEAGLLAKQSSGAICRHRPHFGAKGKEAILRNKRGNRAGGNPKKQKRNKQREMNDKEKASTCTRQHIVLGTIICVIAFILAIVGFMLRLDAVRR